MRKIMNVDVDESDNKCRARRFVAKWRQDVRKEATKGNINTLSRIETRELVDIQSKE